MASKGKIAISLDIGTTSVGWAILKINDNKQVDILNTGVRLFDDPTNSGTSTEDRRLSRGQRRRIRRQKLRKNDFYNLCLAAKIVKDREEFEMFIQSSIFDEDTNSYYLPVEIKLKGLKNKLSKQELVYILHNYIKHRGHLNTIDDDESKEKEKENAGKFDSAYDQNKFPCENQYEWFKITGKVLGNAGNYNFTNEDYQREIDQIFSNQPYLTEDFKKSFKNLFKRHRHYKDGPGSEKSLTPYGRTKLNETTGQLEWVGGNLWDKLVGTCTYFPDKKRNLKKSPFSEVFNLLNDLANLKLQNQDTGEAVHLNTQQKIKILKLPSEKLTLDKIIKEFGYKKDDIVGGLRTDKKDKYVIEELKSTRGLLKWITENKIKPSINLGNFEDLQFLHDIYAAGAYLQNFNDRLDTFKKLDILKGLSNDAIEQLADLKIFSSATASLSIEAQKEFIGFALKDDDAIGKNQMIYFTEYANLGKVDLFSKFKYFPNNYFVNEIMPLTVKRAFNQTIKVVNAILKQYCSKDGYELSNIILEMARELNSEEEKQRISRELKKNEKYLQEKIEEYGFKLEDLKGGDKRLKFLLWVQQNKQDIYDGEIIDLYDLLKNPTKYHIDHILPYSSTFIDSMQNKVLTKNQYNLKKGDRTPYQWLSSEGKFEEFEKRCLRLIENENDAKRKAKLQKKINDFLLYKQDPNEDLNGFVSRQLNDTRYIARELMNKLKMFFKQSKEWNDKHVVVNTVNGSVTNYARKNLFFEDDEFQYRIVKNRDIYDHHAIDACIIGYLGLNQVIQRILKSKVKYRDGKFYEDEDGKERAEIASREELKRIFGDKPSYFRNQMVEFLFNQNNKSVKFSRSMISKTNLQLSNDTLYSLRDLYHDGKKYKVSKVDLLNETDISKISCYFGTTANPKDLEHLLIFERDKKLYDKLNKIYTNYEPKCKGKENPFAKYINSPEVAEELKLKDKENQLLNMIPVFMDNNDLSKINWVRFLKIRDKSHLDVDDVLTLKGHNSNAFYDSLKPAYVKVYKDLDGKLRTIFLNVLLLKWNSNENKLVLDESKLRNELIRKNVITKDFKGDINNIKSIDIKNGTILIDKETSELWYCNGGGHRKLNLIEIKPLWKKPEKQLQMSISTVSKKFQICKTNELGNKFDIHSFEELLD